MPNFDHFDFLAPIYDRVIHLSNPEILIQLANLPSKGKLLDAGGGTGRIAQVLKPQIDTVIVADLSFGMLKQAAHKNNLFSTCTHTEYLPFTNNTFERIVVVDAIHHVCDAQETCLELWRVLKPKGRIVIEEPDIRSPLVKIVAVAEKLAFMRSNFIAPPRIAEFFNGLIGDVKTYQAGYTAWITVDKP
jgi:ubiquinone/menaquinone biosynthesis C-methylase UbiE